MKTNHLEILSAEPTTGENMLNRHRTAVVNDPGTTSRHRAQPTFFNRLFRAPGRLLLGLVLTMGLPMAAHANCSSTGITVQPTNSPTLTGPADQNPVGHQIGGWGGTAAVQYVFDVRDALPWGGCSGNRSIDEGFADSWGIYAGVQYTDPDNKKVFDVYKTDVDGIGYVVGISDFRASGVKDEIPLNRGQNKTYPYPGGPENAVDSIGYRVRVMFVATGRLKTGVYNIQSKQIAKLWVKNALNHEVPAPNFVVLAPTSITVNATSCNVTTPRDQIINMPTVAIGTTDLNSGAAQASFNVAVKCDAGVAVYATVTDMNNPTGTENILHLAPSSTAKGIGLQLFKNGEATPVSFGPDSSAMGNVNQWFVGGGMAAPANAMYDIPFTAKYVVLPGNIAGTGYKGVKGGTFEAAASITFSYQ